LFSSRQENEKLVDDRDLVINENVVLAGMYTTAGAMARLTNISL
jgi:hypothetical protein